MSEKRPNKITPEDVARLLGINAQAVRVRMRNGSLPIGTVTKSPGGTCGYHISPKMLYEVTGMKVLGYEPPPTISMDLKRLAEMIVEELTTKVLEKEETICKG